MNKLRKNLVLTGMMGSGKTTIGKSLSQKLEMGFADVDAIIEKKVGLSISEIFQNQGEKAFRDVEEIESNSIIDIEKVMEIITKRLIRYELRKLKRVEKQPLLN